MGIMTNLLEHMIASPPPERIDAHRIALGSPSDGYERALLTIWQQVLNIPKIGIEDDFFQLGGDSLQALIVSLEIEAQLGYSLSPTSIVQAPTITRLAKFIRTAAGTAASQSLVPLRASGTGLPLFLVSGQGLLAMFFRHLVSDLKSDRPVFGLQPPALDGKHHIARTVESMAADYVSEIRRVQPKGPYFLAGHSFGGRICVEMAQQLVHAGESVSFLGLIDTALGDPRVEGRPWVSEAIHLGRRVRAVDGFQELLFRGLTFIRNTLLDLWIRQGRSIPYQHRAVYYQWLCKRADLKHVSKPYPGHIIIFGSAFGADSSERHRARWAPLARGGLTVLEVPAGHLDIVLPPHSKLLAEHFDACLDATVRRK
jgi:thioesterase domain-containing protein/acyl carrier protein